MKCKRSETFCRRLLTATWCWMLLSETVFQNEKLIKFRNVRIKNRGAQSSSSRQNCQLLFYPRSDHHKTNNSYRHMAPIICCPAHKRKAIPKVNAVNESGSHQRWVQKWIESSLLSPTTGESGADCKSNLHSECRSDGKRAAIKQWTLQGSQRHLPNHSPTRQS